IRARDRGMFTRIAEGGYNLRFQFGKGWLRSRRFCEIYGTSQFVRQLVFTESPDSGGILYDAMEVTLHEVVGGTARTESFPPLDFELPPP
ncbi:MAG: hypothetical protein ACREX3_19030, partial [Gammaproteobacteria bacterium]